jgi:hypothetical protein
MKYGKGEFASDSWKNLLRRERGAKFYESMKLNKKKPVPFGFLLLNGCQIICCNYYDYSKDSYLNLA